MNNHDNTPKNIIETALDNAQFPRLIDVDGLPILLLPKGGGSWGEYAMHGARKTPPRKQGNITLHELDSFIRFVKTHQTAGTQIFIDADFGTGQLDIKATLNGDSADASGFNDHCAYFSPRRSPDCSSWLSINNQQIGQAEFAAFLTRHAHNITASNPNNPKQAYPSAAHVLDFALNLEINQKTTFKSGIRNQDGSFSFEFKAENDSATDKRITAFEKIGVAIQPFNHGATYFVEAFIKFRIDKNSGKLVMWYELHRIEKIIEDAARDTVTTLQAAFGDDVPVYFGSN